MVLRKPMLADANIGLLEEVEDDIVQWIIQIENHFDDSTVNNHLRAHQAWSEGCV